MAAFEPALQLVLLNEGGFADNPDDDGGATNLGISLRFYRRKVKADATVDDIKNLTVNDAAAVYRKYFWNKQPFALILDQKLATRVFDLSVNTGLTEGVTLLQRAVNALSPEQHLVIDGSLGIKTLSAVNKLSAEKLYNELIHQATLFYETIAKHGNDKIFLSGWLHRLNHQLV